MKRKNLIPTDLVRVIGAYTPVVRRMSLAWCACPLCKRDSAEMLINPARHTFRCTACGRRGGATTFVRAVTGLPADEAQGILAAIMDGAFPTQITNSRS